MSALSDRERATGAGQGPAAPRDEKTIARRRAQAVGVADEALRIVRSALYSHAHGQPEQRIDGDEDYLIGVIDKARGEIAEWRPEGA